MSDLIHQLRGQAQLEARGEFTLDIEQAAQKMARFQFPQPQDFLPHLVAGLFRLGAERVEVEEQQGRLVLKVPQLELPSLLLQHLPEALFDETSGHRRLAAAVHALLAFPLTRFLWVGGQPEQTYDYLRAAGHNWGIYLSEIQIEGLPAKLLSAALKELCKKGGWSRRPLRVGERRFQWPFESQISLGGFPAQCEWQPESRPRLLLIMDEIVCEFRAIEAPFAWTGVCYGEFSLDASLSRVLEDERLQRILQEIPDHYISCIQAGLTQVNVSEILTLLQKPIPSWLEPLESKLLEWDLFRDQDGRLRSLAELLSTSETIYHAEGGELKQLEPIILVRPSDLAVRVLQAYLGNRLERADGLVLRRLQREHNQRLWQAQVPEELALSQRHWLYHSEFNHGEIRWLVGIPDDWSQMGASLSIWVEGRKLAASQLLMPEICCEIACQIPSSQVNELWTGMTDRCWMEMQPIWDASLRELLQSLTQGEEPQLQLRSSLKKHLATQAKPQQSYFRKTLLFQDWKGQCYSLDQLLKLPERQALGVVGPQFMPEHFPEKCVPEGVFLRNSGPELTILARAGLPEPQILDYFLEDLQVARESAFQGSEILPQPQFGKATFWFCVDGIRLAAFSHEHRYSFLARVNCQDLKFKALTNNQTLGLERFQLEMTPQVKQTLEALKEAYWDSLQNLLRGRLSPDWLEWLRQATLRGLRRDFLREIDCWPAYPDRLLSLQQLSQAPQVYWCSGEPGPSAQEVDLLLVGLSASVQPALMREAESQGWICLDQDFTRQKRELEVLSRPLWSPPSWGVLAQQEPDLWLMPQGSGRIYWLFQGRLLEETADAAPEGLHLAMECPSLECTQRPSQEELRRRCYSLAAEYLAVPRPSMWEHWQAWRGQDLPPEVAALLQEQQWFETTRGRMSWRQLMAEPEVWLFNRAPAMWGSDLLILWGNQLAVQLVLEHPNGHGLEETARQLRSEEVRRGQLQQQQKMHETLQRFRHHAVLEFGELALSGNARQDLWWLGQGSRLLVENVPAGLTGFVLCPTRPHSLRTGETVVEMSDPERGLLLRAGGQLMRQRLAEGPLSKDELELFGQLCVESEELDTVRWLECADGTYASLHQLRSQPGPLFYWPRKYFFRSAGPELLPILSTPLLLEVVGRACQRPLEAYPPPWLHREVNLQGIRGALSALGRVFTRSDKPSLLGGMRQLLKPPVPPRCGEVLLACLQRRAAQLLSGPAQEILLRELSEARLLPGRQPLWEFQDGLVLHRDHPQLKPWLGSEEPPLTVQTSLLLSLVCATNAASLPFTDAMEMEFLQHLADQVLESRPRG